MANEMFTNREGEQVPIPTFFIPKSELVSLMRLKEDYEQRGEYLSLLGVVMDVLDKGIRQVRNQWKNGDLSKNRRDFSKAVTVYMTDPAKYAKEIKDLAERHGLVKGTPVEMTAPAPEPTPAELTDEQLEKATAPEVKEPA